jgi:hypothetical protein
MLSFDDKIIAKGFLIFMKKCYKALRFMTINMVLGTMV